jgi:hypothetical protein
MLTKRWVFFRVLWPLILATSTRLVHVWFPHNVQADLAPVLLPFLVAVIHLYASSFDRPRIAPRESVQEFNRKVTIWHACDGLACLMLMLFEAISAIGISMDQIGLLALLATIPLLFGPYVLVTWWARANLLGSYEILAAEMMNDVPRAAGDGI